MSSNLRKKQNSASVIIVVLILTIVSFTSCGFSKKAVKSKTNLTVNKEESIITNRSTIDFGTVNKDEFSLNYEPIDYSKKMWVIMPRGDTVQTQNAKVTYTRSKTQKSNNKAENTTQYSVEKEVEESSTFAKEKNEKASIKSVVLLYIMGSVVAIVLFAFYLIYKRIKKKP